MNMWTSRAQPHIYCKYMQVVLKYSRYRLSRLVYIYEDIKH